MISLWCAILAAASASSTQFRGGPDHLGFYDTAGPATLSGIEWSFQTKGVVNASPVVVKDRVFVGSGDGYMYALDADTGRQVWKFKADGPIFSSAALAEERLVFASRAHSCYCLDQKSGKVFWRASLGSEKPFEYGFYNPYDSSPCIHGKSVYIGSTDGHLRSLDLLTGKLNWSFATGGWIWSSPAYSADIVYVGSADGYLYALDSSSGKERWKFATEGVSIDLQKAGFDRRTIESSPAVWGNSVFFGSRDGHLYAVDIRTHQLKWKYDHKTSWVVGSPAVAEGLVLVGSSDGLFVQAIDSETGQEKWRTRMPSNVFSSFSVTPTAAFVGCFDGHVFAFDPKTGQELWRYQTGDNVRSSPVPNDGGLYLGSATGQVLALKGKDEKPAAVERAVYWNSKAPFTFARTGPSLRDVLIEEGYKLLEGPALWEFFKKHIEDGRASVVVLAQDMMPSTNEGDQKLFREYLDKGGKIVNIGLPPFYVELNEKGEIAGIDEELPRKVLGIPIRPDYEDVQSESTPAGKEIGLPDWFVTGSRIDANAPDVVYAKDINGFASAWLKRYSDRKGAGFVVLWGRNDGRIDPYLVKRVAEAGLR